MVEQSASAAPDKCLQPPNCSRDQISHPKPQIPNLSTPIVSPSASTMDLPQISAPKLGCSQIQMMLSGAPVFPPKTPAMSQQQSNLMSPTSNFVMPPGIPSKEQIRLQPGTAMEQSASASPAKSLKPPNPQIPNLSSPIVSPSSTSMDLLQIPAPQILPKMSIGGQQQLGMAMDAQGAIRQRMYGDQMSLGGQQQQRSGSVMALPGMMGPAGQLSMLSKQDDAHFNTQKLVSQSMPSGSSTSTIIPQIFGYPYKGQSIEEQFIILEQQLLKKLQATEAWTPFQMAVRKKLRVVQEIISRQQLSKQMQEGNSCQSVQQQSHIQQQQQRQQHHAALPQQFFPQPYRINFDLQQNVSQSVQQSHIQQFFPQPYRITSDLQQKVSQLVQQQAQPWTVQPQQQAALLLQQHQHLHQLPQLQQQHHEQQSPHVPGFTSSKSVRESKPSIPASGTNMTHEIISQGICDILLGKRTIQDLVSQVDGHVHRKRLKLAHGHLHKKHLKRAQLHLHNKLLKRVRKASEFRRMESDAAKRLEAIQLRD